MGPAGPSGPTGPAGPNIAVLTSVGASANINPEATLGFLGPTVTVTVADGQKVLVIAHKTMGATKNTDGLTLDLCYQPVSGPITRLLPGLPGLAMRANQRLIFSLSGVFTGLAAGDYDFGMCGFATIPADWDNNDAGYVSVMVTP